MDAHETVCKNPSCPRTIAQVGGGHRRREYCDDTCRQMAHRARQEAYRRQQCVAHVQTWGSFQPETVSLLAELLYAGSEDYARRLAGIIRNEQGQDQQQNIVAYQEKLMQAARYTQKLERQVETQHERLGQSYQASSRIAALEQELARYHEVLDLSARTKLQTELLALGAGVNYRRLLNVPTHIEPGADGWLRYAESEPNETLARAVMVARYFYHNLKELGMLS